MDGIIERKFVNGGLISEQRRNIERAQLSILAAEHAKFIESHEHAMIELEFIGYPEDQRFLRLGNDPSRMVMPIRLT